MSQDLPKSVLIFTSTLLYPARRHGTAIRYYPLIRALVAGGYTVDLLIINKSGEPFSGGDVAGQRSICSRLDIVERPVKNHGAAANLLRRIRNVSHKLVPFGIPYELLDNNTDCYRSALASLLSERPRYDTAIGIDLGGCFAEMLIELDENIRPSRIICDLIDSAYLLRRRGRSGPLARVNPLEWIEDRKTRIREQAICERCTTLYISRADARTAGNCPVHILPNGVVTDGYDESGLLDLSRPNIAFMGNMSYPPNEQAALYLVDELFPLMKARIPALNLYIVGRNPTPALQSRGASPGIHVEGAVENIWDYIRSVDVCVFPMLSGAGQQNKVIEAMFAGKVVVTTAIANAGVGAVHGRHLYIAETADEFADYVVRALDDDIGMQAHARQFVEDNYSENGFVSKYLEIIESGRDT